LTDEVSEQGVKKSEIVLELPSPYLAALPSAWGDLLLHENFMDLKKTDAAYLSLTNELVKLVGSGH
jgi:hypothetical protein